MRRRDLWEVNVQEDAGREIWRSGFDERRGEVEGEIRVHLTVQWSRLVPGRGIPAPSAERNGGDAGGDDGVRGGSHGSGEGNLDADV